jgi:hypothetical protein
MMEGAVLSQKYRVLSELGSGAMGVVFLAENIRLPDIRYAVKMLASTLSSDPDFRARFFDEASRHAKLNDPNIVHVFDYFEEGGDLFLVLEYVNGRPLNQFIEEKGGKLAEAQAIAIFRGVLEALDYAHRIHGIIHRDVKPSNILVDQSGRARLTDFGISIRAGDKRMTSAGTPIGTPCYMSPEQIQHPLEIDHRTDVYSAGVVLYEMLAGAVPFDAETSFEILRQHVSVEPPDPRARNPAISKPMTGIVLRALAKDPNRRFQGCAEFWKAIEATRKPPAPRWLQAVAATGAIAAVGAIVWMIVQPTPEPEIQVIEKKDEKAERETISDLVRTAARSAAMMCRDSEMLVGKRRGEKLARLAGETQIAEDYARQVKDLEENVGKLREEFGKLTSRLKDYAADMVDAELEAAKPGSRELGGQAMYVDAVRNAYRQPGAGGEPFPDICPARSELSTRK